MTDDVALDHDNSLRCPVHAPDINPIASYDEWRDVFYPSLHERAPKTAGEATDDKGRFANVSFQVAADYKPEGDEHGILVVITVTAGFAKGRLSTRFVMERERMLR